MILVDKLALCSQTNGTKIVISFVFFFFCVLNKKMF